MELATVINYGTYIFIGFLFFVGFWVGIVYWNYGRKCRGKMIAEIEHPTGFPTHHLVATTDGGRSVEVEGFTYVLGKDKDEGKFPLDEEEQIKKREGDEVIGNPKGKPYPVRKWAKFPDVPFLGLRFLQRTLRAETWFEDNPEPIRPYYGTITADGYFVGTLFATASEITSMKNEAEAAGLVGQIEADRARQKTLENTISKMPSKNVLYILIVAGIIVGVIALIVLFVVYGGMDTLLQGWGFK